MTESEQDNLQEQLAATPSDLVADDVEAETKKRSHMTNAAVAVLVLAAAGGLWFMHAKSGPAAANAASDAKAVKSMLDDNARNVSAMRQQQKDLEKTVQQFKNFPAAAQVKLDDLHRDPFNETSTPKAPKVDVDTKSREQKQAEAMKKVQSLKVQSVMLGEQSRSCMVNGKFRAEGDAFNDFTIETIKHDGVIVRHAGFRFLLQVQR